MKKAIMAFTAALALVSCASAGEADSYSGGYEDGGMSLGEAEQALEPTGHCSCQRRYIVLYNCIEAEGPFIGQNTPVAQNHANLLETSNSLQNWLFPPTSMPISQCTGIVPTPGPFPPAALNFPQTTSGGIKLSCQRVGLELRRCGFPPSAVPLPVPDPIPYP